MNYMYPILDALNDGSVIRKVVKALVLLSAVLMCLATVIGLIVVLKASLQVESPMATIGGILLCLFMIAAMVSGVQVFLYRAKTIDELGPSPFTVVPIIAILVRLWGEVTAVSLTAVAIGGCLAVWLGGPLSSLAGFMGPSSFGDAVSGSFVGGVFVLGLGLAYAAFALLLSYFLAEILAVTVDMARSLRTLVSASGGIPSSARAPLRQPTPTRPTPHPSPAAARPAVPPGPVPSPPPLPPRTPLTAPRCPACGQAVEPDSTFCAECGARL